MFETFCITNSAGWSNFYFKKRTFKYTFVWLDLRKIGSIAIIRETTTKENLNFFDKIKERLKENKRPLLIFPQGTRSKIRRAASIKKESVGYIKH